LIRRLAADFGAAYAVSGLIAFIFAATGPVAIILAVGAQGGLTEADLSSWIFGAFFVNGLISIAFCLAWRQPLVFFWTIPGAVLVGPALGHFSFAEVIGAYLATGALMLVLGLSGWVRRCMEAAPMPIVMAMVAGVFLRFGTGLVHAVRDEPGAITGAESRITGAESTITGAVMASRDITELLLALTPSALSELRDRGLLAYHMNDFSHALRDLEEYLKVARLSEQDDDQKKETEQVWEHVKTLRRRVAQLN